MSNGLQDEQAPIDLEIIEKAIECTPEEWRDFTISLEYVWAEDLDELGVVKCSLASVNNKGLVTPSEDLFLAIQKLNTLYFRYGIAWISAKYHIYLADNNKWKYEANFQY